MPESTVTIFGNLTKAPDLSDTNGVYRCNFRIGSTDSRWDRKKEAFVDAETVFVNVTCWRTTAQNAAQSLGKGDGVVVVGRLRQHSYENKEGATITSVDIDADVVGIDLRKGLASRVRKIMRQAENDRSFDGPAPEDVDVSDTAVPELVGAGAEAPF